MHLNGHVAVSVVGIIIVEPDRENSAEPFHALFAHQGCGIGFEEGGERDIVGILAHANLKADLVRNHIENPRAVLHIRRKMPELFDECSAPDSFQIDRGGAERRFQLDLHALLEDGKRQHFQPVIHIVVNIKINGIGVDHFLTMQHADLVIVVIHAAENGGKRTERIIAEILDFAFADAERGFERSHIHKGCGIVFLLEQRGTATEHHNETSRFAFFGNAVFERGTLRRIEQTFDRSVDGFSEQKDRVDHAVLRQAFREHCFHFGRTFPGIAKIDHGAVGNDIGDPAAEGRKQRSDIAVQKQDFAFSRGIDQLLRHGLIAGDRLCGNFLRDHRCIDRFRIGETERFEHETHKIVFLFYSFYGISVSSLR